MPFPKRVLAQIQTFIASVRGNAARWLAPGEPARLLARVEAVLDERMGRIPPRARKPVLVTAAVGLAALIAVFVGASLPERDPYAGPPPAMHVPAAAGLVPPEELFLPDEPDFVPGVMLGREPRDEWTAEDAEPWWRNPLAGGEERWRAGIESTIDEIMESVP
ncbi:MAG: hypothetical protein FWB79_05630 [Treponema sp.]|nr:hypothetical protein [Treponema sp.]